ncbi:MAG: AAA family ATPase [bacterium]|nr:AAA family ATPase [bacterium]
MILRTLRVAGWRCYAEAVEVGPFGDGLNVLFAPNATGKSTLFEALLRGLLDGHRVTGRDVEALRPWGRSLTPAVTVEFAHDGTEYRLTKRFLDRPIAELERREQDRFVRLAEGDAADDRVREILTRNPPGRGLARPENRGLAQVLWAPQGELALPGLSGDVVAAIRESLGAQVSGPGSGPLESAIEEAYLAIYTPGGQLKRGKDASPLARLRDRLVQASTARTNALEQYQLFEQASRRVEDLRTKRRQARRDEEEMSRTLGEVRRQAEAYRNLLGKKQVREEQVKAAEATHSALKQEIGHIKVASDDLGRIQEALQRVQAELPLLAREVSEREVAAAKAESELEDARRGREQVEEARREAEDAGRYLEASEKVRAAGLLLARIGEAAASLDERKRERAAQVSPDDRTMRAIRRAVRARDDARARLDAALITLEIVPQEQGEIEVVAGEETGVRALAPGRPFVVRGTPEVVVNLPGVARLRARGPAGSAAELRQVWSAAARKVEELTRGYGTSDPDELESLREKARDLDKKAVEATVQLETLLSGRSLGDIQAEPTRVTAEVEAILARRPAWRDSRPDAVALRASAEGIERSFVAGVREGEVAWQSAQTALAAARKRLDAAGVRATEGDRQADELQARLAELTADGKQDDEREADLRRAALAWEAANAGLAEVAAKVDAFGGDPGEAAEMLERQLKGAGDEATRALEEEKSEEGRLQHLSGGGPYSELARAEEEVARLEDEIAREALRANAVLLLHDTVARCRAEALSEVAGPVEAVATRYLQRIAGGGLGRVQLGEAFEPAGVRPEISDSPVPLDSLSGGEKEQIHLATRLALAGVLAKNERQLVVLDDVLTATDAGRLARVLSIIEEAAERLQVLVLTCHPERYRGLDGARFFDLEAILRGNATR